MTTTTMMMIKSNYSVTGTAIAYKLTQSLAGLLWGLFSTSGFDTQVPNPLFQWIITRGSNLIGMNLDTYLSLDQKLEIRAGDLADPDPYWFKANPYTRKIYYHAIHDLGQALVDSPLLACTGFMAGPQATADGHWIMGRNFDSEVGVTMDRDKVIRIHQPEGGIPYISVAFAGMIGAVSGVNEAGIGIAINAAGSLLTCSRSAWWRLRKPSCTAWSMKASSLS